MSTGVGIAPTYRDTQDCASPLLVCQFDPRLDSRWREFVARHPRASVFHSPEWLEALSRTYGYEPIVWTTSPEGYPLQDGLLFCRVESWLTGRRLVSLPFSDHCEPLLCADSDKQAFAAALESEIRNKAWRYVELRPLESCPLPTDLSHTTVRYHFHQLDLTPDLMMLYQRFHKNSIQRKIRRAEREGLNYEEGRNAQLLAHFYSLFTATRARHNVPPQPLTWFRTLMTCFGEAFKIRVVYKLNRPIAAMITLRHKETLVYKYGGSELESNCFGGMHLLYWRCIQEAKAMGLHCFDLGRTDDGQDGLVTFKNRWGATHISLTYSRYTADTPATHVFDLPVKNWKSTASKMILSRLPTKALPFIGTVLYKHVG